jgi:hypothetical protein
VAVAAAPIAAADAANIATVVMVLSREIMSVSLQREEKGGDRGVGSRGWVNPA